MDAPIRPEASQVVEDEPWWRSRALPARVRRAVVVAAGAYAVVGVFAVAYVVVGEGWGDLRTGTKATVAALVAAPLALALLWSRLVGLKAFGFEVSLVQASAGDVQVPGAITEQQYLSGNRELMTLVERLVDRSQPRVRALEINLGDGDYWYPSRLYLVAAVAVDFSYVRAIAFVEGVDERVFVGTASPAAVRSALAAAFPAFEVAYAELKAHSSPEPGRLRAQAAGMVTTFGAGGFGPPGALTPEGEFPRVSPRRLQQWLRDIGAELDTACVEWRGVSSSELVRALVTEFDGEVVPLVRGLRLDRLVDRLELTRRLG